MCDIIEDTKHMFCECMKVTSVKDYFKKLLIIICNIDSRNMNKILHLGVAGHLNKDTNTAVILTTSYIFLKHKRLLYIILKNKMIELFSNKYCNIEGSL